MANPYRKVMYRLKEKWSIREIAELYVCLLYTSKLLHQNVTIPVP